MSEERVTSKATLIEHIERDWTAINQLLDSLSEREWTQIKNPDGWTVKDHVAHLSAWERSILVMLKGQPRHTGLGIDATVYQSDDFDAMNALIFQNHKDDPLEQVRSQFQATHTELMRLIMGLAEEDVSKPHSDFVPGSGSSYPIINTLYGNTAHHYREHQRWIKEMLDS